MKTCNKCGIEKQKTEFSKCSAKISGLRTSCKSCESIAMSAWYSENRQARSDYNKDWNIKNRELRNALNKKWKDANPEKVSRSGSARYERISEKIKESVKLYQSLNPDATAANSRNRRARKRSAEGRHGAMDVIAIFSAQRGFCANCNTRLFKSGPNKFHADHITPLSAGGSNWPANIQCLCPQCNLKKHAKDPIDWANENGRLL